VPALFHYTARSSEGAFVRGSLEAADAAAALGWLRARALFVTSLESGGIRGTVANAIVGKAGAGATAAFFRSFSVLVHAGVPMRRALDVSVQQCADGRLREALAAVAADLENGLSLSDAMARRPKDFRMLHVTLIKAGETGGVLDDVLQRVAALLETERAARKRLGAALVYPGVVATAACGLVVFLLASVVPMFRSMYDQLHVPLPPITAILLITASAMQVPWTWALAGLGAVSCAAAARSATVREALLLRIPFAGSVMRKASLAMLARTLGTLLQSGVGIVASLEVAADVVANTPYAESLAVLRSSLASGAAFSDTLSGSGLYEPLFIQMLRVGEETGTLDAMLLRIAEYYDLDVETALAALGSLLEPLLMLFLGGAVAFITAAVFIPLYSLIGSMK
jgi:type IV pilus assembly protein PilC